MKTILERFEEKYIPEPMSGCWIWIGGENNTGYPAFNCPEPQKTTIASRASWILHKGLIPDGLDACHKCDTRLCVNPDHLFLGTRTANFDDARKKKRIGNFLRLDGGKNKRFIFTDDQIREIRYLSSSGMGQKELAHKMACGLETIGRIVRRERYCNV